MGWLVVDASYYPSLQLGVAAQMVRQAIGDKYDIDGLDGVLVSCVHPQQNRVVERLRKKYGRTIVGGPGALSPGAFEAASCVVCGDYQTFVKSLLVNGYDSAAQLPNVYIPGGDSSVSIDNAFPYAESGKYKGEDGRTTVFCSRGCKHRCAFCQTGWATVFSENPDPQSIVNLPADDYNYMSNALGEVSFFSKLPITKGSSHTLASAVAADDPGRLVRVGVEGVSERLRKAVGKPITNDFLVDGTLSLNSRHTQVRWFLIAGLPGETAGDWDELRDCVRVYVAAHKMGTLQISFTAYVPEPATPIAGLPYIDDYFENYKRFADWYFGKARIAHLSIFRPQGPVNRAKKAAAQTHPGNMRMIYPHRDRIKAAVDAYRRWTA